MRKFALVTTVALLAASPGVAEERIVNLSVPGMFCSSCPFVVQAAIGDVDGVLSVATDVDARTAFVRYDDAVATVDEITAASENAGYKATVIVDDAEQS